MTPEKKSEIKNEVPPEGNKATFSDLSESLVIDACGCCEDSSGYFESDGDMFYDASCGCVNFR